MTNQEKNAELIEELFKLIKALEDKIEKIEKIVEKYRLNEL